MIYKEDRYEEDKEFTEVMHNIIRKKYYPKIWKDFVSVESFTTGGKNKEFDLKLGIDRRIILKKSSLLIQERFRRSNYYHYNDLTIRFKRPLHKQEFSEFFKIKADLFVYGWANKEMNDFLGIRIIKIKELIELIKAKKIKFKTQENPDGSSNFLIISFNDIPKDLIFYWWDKNF